MPPKKEAPKTDTFVEVGFVLLVILFIFIIWSAILQYLFVDRFGSYATVWQNIVAWFMQYLYPIMVVLAVIICVLSIIGIVYNYRRLLALNEEEKKIFGSTYKSGEADVPVVNKNEKWERIVTHMNSANSSDWRLAVIEADVMLDELLRAQGYHGDSVGEMLKGVEKSDFLTLDNAWEAHKVRNEIAHAGGDYLLNEREIRRVITLFESVFREFKII